MIVMKANISEEIFAFFVAYFWGYGGKNRPCTNMCSCQDCFFSRNGCIILGRIVKKTEALSLSSGLPSFFMVSF